MSININDCESQEFRQKFGQKLKYFGSAKHVFDFNLFPNIESIDENSVVKEIRFEDLLQLNSDKLKKLKIGIIVSEEQLLPQVMQKFQNLTHLTLRLVMFSPNESWNTTFKDFPSHQNLMDLFISFRYNQDFEGMCDPLKKIAIKCPKLKRLVLADSTIVLKKTSEAKHFFQLLKAFPALKRLKMVLKDETDLQSTDQWFSFALFKGMPKITHLSLWFPYKSLKESALKEIDINLPNLQYLQIRSVIDTTPEGVQQMAEILSRLSSLQTIILWFKHEVNYQPMKAMIIKKCLKIKTIDFN